MRPAGKKFQHADGVRFIKRFAEGFTLIGDKGIGCQDIAVRMNRGTGGSFPPGEKPNRLGGGKVAALVNFGSIRFK
jgi:hypothetical protein